jgi:prefoldin alpha subunit
MTQDEELTKYLALIEQYKEQMNSLEMQSQYVQSAIMDYNKAKITLENLNKTEKDKEIILPIGGSTFLSANLKDPSNVLFDIGAGVVAEKKTEDAIVQIDKKIEELQKTQEQISSVMQNLQNTSAEVTAKAQKLLAENEKEGKR